MNLATMLNAFNRDIAATATELPQVFYWQGVAYTGQQVSSSDALAMVDVGYLQDSDFQLIVQLSIFGTVTKPTEKSELEIPNADGSRRKYSVQTVNTAADGVSALYIMKVKNV